MVSKLLKNKNRELREIYETSLLSRQRIVYNVRVKTQKNKTNLQRFIIIGWHKYTACAVHV